MKKLFALFLALAMVLSLVACGGAAAPAATEAPAAAEAPAAEAPAAEEPVHLLDKPMTFKVATTQASNGLWVKYMTAAYEEITELTNGDLVFEIYPDSELGKNDDCVEQILAGAPMILGCGFDTMTNFSDKLAVASSPYVFQDMSEVFTLVETDWWDTTVAELADSANLQIFAVGTLGYRHFISTFEINSAADCAGHIMRMGPSGAAQGFITVMNGTPTTSAWADNYSLLQTGVIDSCEAPLSLLLSSSLGEVCDYLALSGHFVNPFSLTMNPMYWEQISAADQAIVKETLAAACVEMADQAMEMEAEFVQAFKDQGVTVTEPDKASFGAVVPELFKLLELEPSIYDDIRAAIEANS